MPTKTSKKVPDLDPKLFWDVEYPTNLQFSLNYFYIIERALMRGSIRDFLKIKAYYSKKQIQEVILNSRQFSNKTRYFFGIYYKLKLDQLLCLPERSNQKLWNY
ncbi:MAG: hypothetical protein WCK98_07290 [bacterium]